MLSRTLGHTSLKTSGDCPASSLINIDAALGNLGLFSEHAYQKRLELSVGQLGAE